MNLTEFKGLWPLIEGKPIMICYDTSKRYWYGPYIYHTAHFIGKQMVIHSNIKDYGYPRFRFIKLIRKVKIYTE